MAERPDFLKGYNQDSVDFIANLPRPFTSDDILRSLITEENITREDKGKSLEILRTDIADNDNQRRRYELRAGFTKIADVIATKESRIMLWRGVLPLQSVEDVVFDQLPHILYPNHTIPSPDILKAVSRCAYYLKGQTEDESKKLRLDQPLDWKAYNAVISNAESLGGIGYKVKPLHFHNMGTYELGVVDKSHERDFSNKQKIRLVVPSSVGCSSTVLQWMIGTMPQKAVDDIDPVASAHSLEELIQRDRIF